jgi:hypothetical protein
MYKELKNPTFEFEFTCPCGYEVWLQVDTGIEKRDAAEQACLRAVRSEQIACPHCGGVSLGFSGKYHRRARVS